MRVRPLDPAGYLLALAAVALFVGFGFMTYEAARFGEHADPWHHFWFEFGVGWLVFAVILVGFSIFFFLREMRQPDQDYELRAIRSAPDEDGVEGEEVAQRVRSPQRER